MKEEKGVFASLFDFSFTEFITTKIIKVLYALSRIHRRTRMDGVRTAEGGG